ncbi:hypothetical protein E2C01_005100 [Portunus trituberculatus]|uniref:Uncharacterized protein n=1 Tax=Portunus trituberculatus TaxID=210409 RepID=A0A5B7CS87_PORTR|nr:hypothetical protein [Portunus trituberculatus]
MMCFLTLIGVAKAQPLTRSGWCRCLPLVTRRRRKPQPVMKFWSGGGGVPGITTPVFMGGVVKAAPARPYTSVLQHTRDTTIYVHLLACLHQTRGQICMTTTACGGIVIR